MRDTGQLGDKQEGDGIYTGTALMINSGTQKLHLIAKSATFERETLRTIKVLAPPPAAAPVKPVRPAPAPAKPKAPDKPLHDHHKPVEKGLSTVWVLIGFVTFNVLVGSIVILVVLVRKWRADAKAAASAATESDDGLTP